MQEPTVIGGRYRIQKLIGQGGIGQVYHAIDTRTNDAVAVKVLKPNIVRDEPKLVERFIREGKALQELNHPNIVKILEAFEENGEHYIVMEYVSGGSLHDLLKQAGRMPLERVLYIALDLSDALTRAHRLKIIHRDIKPANVLLADDGTPRLTDFGTVRIEGLHDLTQEGGIVGTVSYLSPEACQGQSVDARTDIWSFGIMLFEMLTGQRPFDKPETLATVIAIVKDPLPDLVTLWPDAPPKLVNLIYRMLEKKPEQRISSMRLVGAELESIIGQADTGVRQALDLIYRMLEREDGQPTPSMRLVGAKLGFDTKRADPVPAPHPAQKQSITIERFEQNVSSSAASPAQPASHAAPPRTLRRETLIIGGLVALVVLLVIVLLLIAM